MKYFHRSHLDPDAVLTRAAEYFGARLAPVENAPRRQAYAGAIGRIAVDVQAEGGHYTLITVETDQVG